MDKFTQHRGVTAPILRGNVDTDAIIPSREMKRVSKQGLGEGMFAGWRYTEVGGREVNPDFILNQAEYAGTSILLSGPNFGCGSSREHAVWALKEYGIRAIIAPSFGAIFANNCIRNGLLPLVLNEESVAHLAAWVEQDPVANQVLVDLPAQTVFAGEGGYAFDIDAGAKRMLVEGLDAIALTQTRWEVIEAFHQQRQQRRPWLYC
ncbi:3-isopropylmalate dehydratase small subunit [Halioglobus maricola]|uniref:3-isopropylmalate dehydratase small subunit n=2 Tax=Halioglobus maricola TaxID=2601894 RepID=A0A5P9NRU0_9GAMM|nr:3-isopropylmalate dehydratase small subunit [Halioglobus maricola]